MSDKTPNAQSLIDRINRGETIEGYENAPLTMDEARELVLYISETIDISAWNARAALDDARVEHVPAEKDESYAIGLHSDGTSTDMNAPYCKDCGSNDIQQPEGALTTNRCGDNSAEEQVYVAPVVDIPQNAAAPPMMALAEGFGDPETLLNSRDWMRKAIEAKGAKVTGGGVGMGQADLDFTLEGCSFNVSLRPLLKNPDPSVGVRCAVADGANVEAGGSGLVDGAPKMERPEGTEFAVWAGSEFEDFVAQVNGPRDTALAEARHYAAQSLADGLPVRIEEVTRRTVETLGGAAKEQTIG